VSPFVHCRFICDPDNRALILSGYFGESRAMRLSIGFGAARLTRAVVMVGILAGLVGPADMPLAAQVRTVDPNTAIDADLAPLPQQGQPQQGHTAASTSLPSSSQAQTPSEAQAAPDGGVYDAGATAPATATGQPVTAASPPAAPNAGNSYQKDDLIGAAEGVFGKGAEGLAGLIEKILKDQGQPNAYIAGREASGAFVVGLRYGSGTLNHKVEGRRDIYWTGPSVGFDAGGNAGNTFVLVYNLYDTQDIYRRFPAGEGAAYFIGGFNASYLRRGNIVLIPIRLGVGYRLGINAGYMKFTEKRTWMPF
jgi:hypothetical protein